MFVGIVFTSHVNLVTLHHLINKIMEDLKLKIEQQETKEKLAKLMDYINSEEYYKLSPNRRLLLKNRKLCLEMYLGVLNMEVYEDVDAITVPDMGFLGIMGGLFGNALSFPKSPSVGGADDESKKEEFVIPANAV